MPVTQTALPPIDPDADRFIGEQFGTFPSARYRITQMAFVQEAALAEAQNRIKRLEYDLQNAQAQAQQPQPQPQATVARPVRRPVRRWRPAKPRRSPAYQPQYAPPPQPSYPPGYQPGMFQAAAAPGFLGSALDHRRGRGRRRAGGRRPQLSMFRGGGGASAAAWAGGFGGGGFGGGGFGGGGEVVNETTVNNYGHAGRAAAVRRGPLGRRGH